MKKTHTALLIGAVITAALAPLHADDLYWSGADTWDTSTANWGNTSGGPYNTSTWSNGAPDSATFQGTAGTVALGTDINIENLTVNLPTGGGVGYSIGEVGENNTLTFSGTKTLTVTATGTGTNQDVSILAGIIGSPTLNITARSDNNANSFQLLPGSGVTQTIGTLNMLNTLASNKRLILGGESTGNVVDSIVWATTSNQMFLTKRGTGSWTINNNVLGSGKSGRLYVEQGTLTLGGTANFFTHKISVATNTGTNYTASGLDSKLIAKGTVTIGDNREYFYVQNKGMISPGSGSGPGIETLNVTWNANNNGTTTNGQFNMQTGSTYEWDVVSATSTDVINVTTGGSNVGNLILGNMTISIRDAGAATAIGFTDQLTLFTYETGAQTVTRSIGTIDYDTSSLGAGWTFGTLAVTDDNAGRIYLTGLQFAPIPEPSNALLGAFGALALLRRRRR
jgi:fibronectin-binding autotransporter adhesin